MSFALPDFSLSFLTLYAPGELLFNDPQIEADAPTVDRPAYMRIMNESNFGLYMTMMSSGRTFWMRAGDCIVVPIFQHERGLRYICQYIIGNPSIQVLWCTYFDSREGIYELEELGNSALSSTLSSFEYTSLTATGLNSNLLGNTNLAAFIGGKLSLQVTGTWVGTIQVHETQNIADFIAVVGDNNTGGGTITNIVANGIYTFGIYMPNVRVRMTAYTSGTANGTVKVYRV